jgi:hypothetical protein
MSAASVAVIYADRQKSARVFVKIFCFFCPVLTALPCQSPALRAFDGDDAA